MLAWIRLLFWDFVHVAATLINCLSSFQNTSLYMTLFLCEVLAQCKMLTRSKKLSTMLTSICQEKEKLSSIANTFPHAWQKHFLPANQNSVLIIKLQSLPAHLGKYWHHSTNIWREANSMSNACGHFVFGVLKIRTLLNSPQKNTDSHFAIRQVRTVISFMAFLILQHWPVCPSAKVASFILAEVCLSSFLLAFASSRLNLSSCFFSLMNLSHGLSSLHLLLAEETSLIFGTR